MDPQTYAVVVYLDGPLAQLVDHLRLELNREYAGKAAHVTVLPPRPLAISEEAAVEEARARCAEWDPFELEVTGPSTFWPVNGVVYLELSLAADKIRQLHHALNQGHLYRQEPYEYTPHITIAQDMSEERTFQVMERVANEFAAYSGPRRIIVERLIFVRQTPEGNWIDLADLHLGRARVAL